MSVVRRSARLSRQELKESVVTIKEEPTEEIIPEEVSHNETVKEIPNLTNKLIEEVVPESTEQVEKSDTPAELLKENETVEDIEVTGIDEKHPENIPLVILQTSENNVSTLKIEPEKIVENNLSSSLKPAPIGETVKPKRKYVRKTAVKPKVPKVTKPKSPKVNKIVNIDDVSKVAISPKKESSVPETLEEKTSALAFSGKTTTTIHKTADKLEIIKMFKRKSRFPDVKESRSFKNLKKPVCKRLVDECGFIIDNTHLGSDTRDFSVILSDLKNLSQSSLTEIIHTLEDIIIPEALKEEKYEFLSEDYSTDVNMDITDSQRENDISPIHKTSSNRKSNDMILHELYTNHTSSSLDEDITKTIAKMNGIDVSHIDAILRDVKNPTTGHTAYTEDLVTRDSKLLTDSLTGLREK